MEHRFDLLSKAIGSDFTFRGALRHVVAVLGQRHPRTAGFHFAQQAYNRRQVLSSMLHGVTAAVSASLGFQRAFAQSQSCVQICRLILNKPSSPALAACVNACEECRRSPGDANARFCLTPTAVVCCSQGTVCCGGAGSGYCQPVDSANCGACGQSCGT